MSAELFFFLLGAFFIAVLARQSLECQKERNQILRDNLERLAELQGMQAVALQSIGRSLDQARSQ